MPRDPERPVRLTFPSYDVGAARIVADGKQVGHILGRFSGRVEDWEAFLWVTPNVLPANPDELETEVFPNLRAARAGLRERVAEKGAWWEG